MGNDLHRVRFRSKRFHFHHFGEEANEVREGVLKVKGSLSPSYRKLFGGPPVKADHNGSGVLGEEELGVGEFGDERTSLLQVEQELVVSTRYVEKVVASLVTHAYRLSREDGTLGSVRENKLFHQTHFLLPLSLFHQHHFLLAHATQVMATLMKVQTVEHTPFAPPYLTPHVDLHNVGFGLVANVMHTYHSSTQT